MDVVGWGVLRLFRHGNIGELDHWSTERGILAAATELIFWLIKRAITQISTVRERGDKLKRDPSTQVQSGETVALTV